MRITRVIFKRVNLFVAVQCDWAIWKRLLCASCVASDPLFCAIFSRSRFSRRLGRLQPFESEMVTNQAHFSFHPWKVGAHCSSCLLRCLHRLLCVPLRQISRVRKARKKGRQVDKKLDLFFFCFLFSRLGRQSIVSTVPYNRLVESVR